MNITSNDYITVTDESILFVTQNGIELSNGSFIDFQDCAYNYALINGGDGNCIGERDWRAKSFQFYTAPLTTCIVFPSDVKIKEFLFGNEIHKRFYRLQKQITEYGYTTYDIS